MTKEDIKNWFIEVSQSESIFQVPQEFLSELNQTDAKFLAEDLLKSRMMKLPESEILFFEWLKANDRKVWDDLWANQDEGEYLVSSSFLPLLVNKDGRGFPICDLLETDNFFFVAAHMVDHESKIVVETAQKMLLDKKALTVAQLLSVEINIAPIDIWRFAYKHGLRLETAKKAVQELVDDEALVHLSDAEHLAPFIDF